MSQVGGEKAGRSHRPRPDRTGSVAARVNWLVEHVHPPGQRPFSGEEIAQGMRANGLDVSADYVRKILSGNRPTPEARYLEGMAYVLGTNLSFFTGDGTAPINVEEMRDLAMLRSPRLRKTMTAVIRDRGLQEIVELMIDVPPSLRPVVADMIRAGIQMHAQASMARGDARPSAGN